MHVRMPFVRRYAVAARLALIALVAAAAVGAARAAHTVRPATTSAASLRGLIREYRSVTWTFERAARRPRQPTSFGERRTSDRVFLRWSVDLWTRRAYVARTQAVRSITHRLAVTLPTPPSLRSRLAARISYSRRLTFALARLDPLRRHRASRTLASARMRAGAALRLWQRRSALEALAVSRHAIRHARIPAWLGVDLQCIHSHEAAWTANTGNGYFGGLQMDIPFQRHYGAAYVVRYGTADRWPVWAQLEVAARAYRTGRGFWPWPNTARACGLI